MTVLHIKSFKIRAIFKFQQYIKVFLQKFTLLYTNELYSWAHSFSGVLLYIIESRSASMVNKIFQMRSLVIHLCRQFF